MVLFKMLITMLCVLLGVAFLTLLERKLLAYIQIRKGPNKVGFSGFFQPFADALKLFTKELLVPHGGNVFMFSLLPAFGLGLGLYAWGFVPSSNMFHVMELACLLFLLVSALNVYVVLGAGWASNSSYSFLGGLRASAQTISYEISLVFLLFLPLFLGESLNIHLFMGTFPICWFFVFSLALWGLSILAETNRAPFDFAEGESELVSGFNVEYAGGLFALLFLGEYTMILLMSMLTSFIWFAPGGNLPACSWGFVIAMGFLVIRGVYPRLRYDKLMDLCWKAILPVAISMISFLCLFFFY